MFENSTYYAMKRNIKKSKEIVELDVFKKNHSLMWASCMKELNPKR